MRCPSRAVRRERDLRGRASRAAPRLPEGSPRTGRRPPRSPTPSTTPPLPMRTARGRSPRPASGVAGGRHRLAEARDERHERHGGELRGGVSHVGLGVDPFRVQPEQRAGRAWTPAVRTRAADPVSRWRWPEALRRRPSASPVRLFCRPPLFGAAGFAHPGVTFGAAPPGGCAALPARYVRCVAEAITYPGAGRPDRQRSVDSHGLAIAVHVGTF